jgi:hypothetical protein
LLVPGAILAVVCMVLSHLFACGFKPTPSVHHVPKASTLGVEPPPEVDTCAEWTRALDDERDVTNLLPTRDGGVVIVENVTTSSAAHLRITMLDRCGVVQARRMLELDRSVGTGNACIDAQDRVFLAGAANDSKGISSLWITALDELAVPRMVRRWPSRYAEIVAMAWDDDGPYVLIGGHQVEIGGRTFVDDQAPEGLWTPGPLWLVGFAPSGEARFVQQVGRGEGGYLLATDDAVLALTQKGGERTISLWTRDGRLLERQSAPGVFGTPIWQDNEALVRAVRTYRAAASRGECTLPPSVATLVAVDRRGRLLESVFDDTPARRRTKVLVRELDGKVSSERVVGDEGAGPLVWGHDGSAFRVSFAYAQGVMEVTKWRP